MHVDYNLIGNRIKNERRSRGYTQETLAEQLNVSVGYVSQVERGITKISLDLLAAIATILECDLALLVTGAAIKNGDYMANELTEQFRSLDSRDKALLLGFIQLLKSSK